MLRMGQDALDVGLGLCVYVAQVADTASTLASCVDLPGVPDYYGRANTESLSLRRVGFCLSARRPKRTRRARVNKAQMGNQVVPGTLAFWSSLCLFSSRVPHFKFSVCEGQVQAGCCFACRVGEKLGTKERKKQKSRNPGPTLTDLSHRSVTWVC